MTVPPLPPPDRRIWFRIGGSDAPSRDARFDDALAGQPVIHELDLPRRLSGRNPYPISSAP